MVFWKYVDDLTLAENRSFPQPSGMQVVLNKWTNNNPNKLRLNPSKCQALQVCFKTNTPPHAELSIVGVPLSFVNEANLRFLEYGFKMICSGIRILMRSPRKPIKNCTFSGCSRSLDSMMMSSCLFTNAMSDPLLNMLMLLGLPLSLCNRGKFWNTCKKARAEPS